MRRPLVPLLALSGLALGFLAARIEADAGRGTVAEAAAELEGLQIWPFGLMDAVRDPFAQVTMGVQLYNASAAPVFLDQLELRDERGESFATLPLHGEALVGDGGAVAELHRMMEAVSPDLSHRHTHRLFIPLEERVPLGPEAEAQLLTRIVAGVRELQAGGAAQLRNLRFPVELARVLGGGLLSGDRGALTLVVSGRDAAGVAWSARLEHAIELLEPFYGPPAERLGTSGPGAWHAGDLHVHNCRDEAVAGCNSCAAESFNITGSFTNAQLKPQFQALGFDYFSTTTHSYCINSNAEFSAVLSESQSLTDPNFVLICGTEISGRESGPQSGSDSADALCSLGFGEAVHHMGAHGVSVRKPGGSDGFLDFCDAPINTQSVNWAAVNAEGGFTIANHPAADYWAYNSVAYLKGQEANGLWGVEVWNGSEGTALFSNPYRDWWLARLREGRLLYPYSGSDTHDAAYNFGATHTFVSGPLTPANLLGALKSGRNYLSNGPYLEMEVRGGSSTLRMGELISVPRNQVPPNFAVTVELFYNLSPSLPSTLTIYRGTLQGETVIAQFSGLLGGGSVPVTDLVPSRSCYWRAEVVNSNSSGSAMTTPVFLRLY